jgi:hypothetical protein
MGLDTGLVGFLVPVPVGPAMVVAFEIGNGGMPPVGKLLTPVPVPVGAAEAVVLEMENGETLAVGRLLIPVPVPVSPVVAVELEIGKGVVGAELKLIPVPLPVGPGGLVVFEIGNGAVGIDERPPVPVGTDVERPVPKLGVKDALPGAVVLGVAVPLENGGDAEAWEGIVAVEPPPVPEPGAVGPLPLPVGPLYSVVLENGNGAALVVLPGVIVPVEPIVLDVPFEIGNGAVSEIEGGEETPVPTEGLREIVPLPGRPEMEVALGNGKGIVLPVRAKVVEIPLEGVGSVGDVPVSVLVGPGASVPLEIGNGAALPEI